MGYVHMWDSLKTCTDDEWRAIRVAVMQLLATTDILVVWESDCDGVTHPRQDPEVSADMIHFNGPGKEGLETLLVQREGGGLEFCKTARMCSGGIHILPYDALVVATLALMNHYAPGAWRYKTDGDPDELAYGLQLASDAAGKPIGSPFTTWE